MPAYKGKTFKSNKSCSLYSTCTGKIEKVLGSTAIKLNPIDQGSGKLNLSIVEGRARVYFDFSYTEHIISFLVTPEKPLNEFVHLRSDAGMYKYYFLIEAIDEKIEGINYKFDPSR